MGYRSFHHSEGDSSFNVSISDKTKQVKPRYGIGLHIRDTVLIHRIQNFVVSRLRGKIYTDNNHKIVSLFIENIPDLSANVIPHFKKYPLQGNKLPNFMIWSEIIDIVVLGKHLTHSGPLLIYVLS